MPGRRAEYRSLQAKVSAAVKAAGSASERTLRERSGAIIEGLERVRPEVVLHLASSTLRVVISHFIDGPGAANRRVFAMPREEEGIAIATGLELAGKRTVLIFQDNGIGNLLTVLLTLPQAYHVPLFAVVARRGGLGEYNSAIHGMSERTCAVLDAAGIRWFELDGRTPVGHWADQIVQARTFSQTTHRPIFMLVDLLAG